MVGRMGGGLHSLVEIELEMAKMPAFTNLKLVWSTGLTATVLYVTGLLGGRCLHGAMQVQI